MGNQDTKVNSPAKHIALVGFMGAGKTTVGKALAEALQRNFIDVDDAITEVTGKTISDIFRESGEVVFRARERGVIRDLLNQVEPMVIATGGGTFADPQSRSLLRSSAHTVYLKASSALLAHRLIDEDGKATRPMLAGPDPLATLNRLLDSRVAAYEESQTTVVCDHKTVSEIVTEVVNKLQNKPSQTAPANNKTAAPAVFGTSVVSHPFTSSDIDVHNTMTVASSAGEYPVIVHAEAGAWIAEAITSIARGQRIAVISDATVAGLHAAPLIKNLQNAGKQVTLLTFAPGEESKSLDTVAMIYDQLLDAGFGRNDLLVALGGGVVGDLTGFVAATYMRGIAYVQVPTTTLAAVDSSVGGKTGVNTLRGKNLVGAFYPPKAVLLSASHLATQTRRAHAAGLVEALKMAVTLDCDLFDDMIATAEALLDFEPTMLLPTILRAISLKADVVAQDEHEQGMRAVLNFGHTIGHAIEAGEGYRLLHGEAVALGMVGEAQWAEQAGLSREISKQIERGLSALDVPAHWQDARFDMAALGLDKKRVGSGVLLPIVREIGSFELRTIPMATLTEFLERARA